MYMRTALLPNFLREVPVPLGYKGIKVKEITLLKVIKLLNIRDYYGRLYFPEVLYALSYSFSGTSSSKLEKSYQMHYYMRKLRRKYTGLGKQCTWKKLCGIENKIFAKRQLTAAEHLAGIKVLKTWRDFKKM